MQMILPDILAETRQFSVAFSAASLAVGLLLWLFGWWGHRFWIVLVTTVAAGAWGLYSGKLVGVQPLAAGLLLAVTAGLLALSLVRLLAFGAGGVAGWLAMRALAPSWEEPLVWFLAGGLGGLLLFRLWTMALTSMGGTLLMTYAALGLADRLGKLDALAVAETRIGLLNGCCLGVAFAGLVVQFLGDRWRARREAWQEERALAHLSESELQQLDTILRRRPWWSVKRRLRPRPAA